MRVLVTVALLAALAVSLDWDALARRVEQGHASWMAAAVAAMAAGLLVGAWRWYELLRVADVPGSWRSALRGYMAGAFANNFLPTGFGGDVVRALAVARPGPALARAGTTVIVDRLTALVCLVLLAWLILPLDAAAVPAVLVVALAAVTTCIVLALAASQAAFRFGAVGRVVPAAARPLLAEMRRPLAAFAADRTLVARVFALGLLYQALVVTGVWCAARAIELELSFALAAVTVPLVLILTLIPVSLAGFGVREGAFVVVLRTVGVEAAEATLLSLLTFFTMGVASLPGALALVVGARRNAF